MDTGKASSHLNDNNKQKKKQIFKLSSFMSALTRQMMHYKFSAIRE